jgi:choice-of-anchor B domain-containing protein
MSVCPIKGYVRFVGFFLWSELSDWGAIEVSPQDFKVEHRCGLSSVGQCHASAAGVQQCASRPRIWSDHVVGHHIMKKTFSAAAILAATLSVAVLATSAFAHDDAKVRDRQKPYRGAGWREVDGKPIEGSVAGAFDSNGVLLRSWLPLADLSAAATSGNSCWGYVAPNGAEFAVIGLSSGTAFVDITNPGAATLKAFISGPTSLWRDVRVYNGFCYAGSEAGSGIQVMNLGRLHVDGTVTLIGTVTDPTTTTAASHTLALDATSGFLYRAGGGATGLRIYDLSNPAAPAYVGAWSSVYVHEAQVKTFTSGPFAGRQIAFCCGGLNSGNVNTGLYIVDVTNKLNPIQLAYVTYPNARYCHQGWLDEQQQYFYINDELDEGATVTTTTTIVIDVSNLTAPTFVGTFSNGNAAVGHNLFVKGTKLFEANYRSGFRVFDLAVSRTNPPEVAFFDTYPGSDTAQFNGLWNIWPYFPSGTVIGSDIERGLFVWTVAQPVATFAVAAPPATILPPGGTTVDVSITAAAGQTLNPSTARMVTSWPPANSVTTNMSLVSGTTYRATFPAVPCLSTANYRFEIANTAGEPAIDTATRTTLSVVALDTIVNSTFETADGWVGGVAGDTATAGLWTRVDPVGTQAQPENDHSEPGTLCWVTGQGAVGGADGAADVDGGVTTLLSPTFDLTSLDEPQLEYWYWYSNNLGGAPNADSMPIQISGNNGATWVTLADVAISNNQWSRHVWRVRDFITPTATVRVRFQARDLGTGSLVEAAIDDFRITNIDCTANTIPGDLDGNGSVNGADLATLLNNWGASGATDIDGNGSTDGADLAILLNNWS